MATVNVKNKTISTTHNGAPARPQTDFDVLKRSVLNCLLWEKTFYEEGESIADRIKYYTSKPSISMEEIASLAKQARKEYGIRHAPLLLLLEMIRRGGTTFVSQTIRDVITRPDDMMELVALYWQDGKRPLSSQMKKGLKMAFEKFDSYQIAKYGTRKNVSVSLRDVMFLVHPKPRNRDMEIAYSLLANKEISAPDTWESNLSEGYDKKETFERLLKANKLGYMALLRNLRNMEKAGVDRWLVDAAIRKGDKSGMIFPYRYLMAYRQAPMFKDALNEALHKIKNKTPYFAGKTVIMVDVSASMFASMSENSDVTYMEAAASLAAFFNGEQVRLFTFSEKLVEVPYTFGLDCVDDIVDSQENWSTELFSSYEKLNRIVPEYDRIIIITDEQANYDNTLNELSPPKGKSNIIINVAPYKNGIKYKGNWTNLNGWSAATLTWLYEMERMNDE